MSCIYPLEKCLMLLIHLCEESSMAQWFFRAFWKVSNQANPAVETKVALYALWFSAGPCLPILPLLLAAAVALGLCLPVQHRWIL